ncbi:hypothetical protein KC845_01515 [Candidatus Kaiserbacteria bacterium]|nr:hypothetical protein [Candidatus Kaiserbacteria bacterium]
MHHAILLVGDNISESNLPTEYKQAKTDVTHIIEPTLTIGQVRSFIDSVYLKPISDKFSVFVIETRNIPIEAQQALLKMLEEQQEHVRIFLIVPRADFLLSTVRSRLFYDKTLTMVRSKENVDFTAFLNSSIDERLKQVADRVKKKDLKWINDIVLGSERLAEASSVQNSKLLDEVVFVRSQIDTRGASKKMLLESLAISLPKKG